MTLARALRRVPGVEITRTGAQAEFASASLRGATGAQTPVYLAGVRLNDEVAGAADLSLVPVWLLDRVEVYRGNAPEHAEELGIGGAIFAEPSLPQRAELRGGASFGSFGERGLFARASAGGQPAAATFAVRVHGATNDYEYLHDNGTRFTEADDRLLARKNADFREVDVWALTRYRPKRSARVTALVNALDREQGVTGLSLYPAEQARNRTRRLLLGVSTRIGCGRTADDCELELGTSAKLVREELTDPLGELSAPLSRFVDARGGRLSQNVSFATALGRFRLGASAGALLDTLAVVRRASQSIAAGRRSARAGLSGRWRASEKWSVHGLIRGECHDTRGPLEGSPLLAPRTDELCDVLEPTGRIGSLYEVSRGLSLLGNVGRYVRLPTLGEFYGTSPVVRGNADLETETAWNTDLGVRFGRTGPVAVSLEAFAFLREAENLIAYRRASLGIVRPYNTQSARLLGAEAAALVDVWSHLRAGTSLTLLDARDTTPQNPLRNDLLPLKSRLVLGPSVEVYDEGGYAPLEIDGAGLRIGALYRSSRYADNAGLVVLEPELVFDVDVILRFFRDRLRFSASVENALDARYLDIIGLPLPGRSFHLSAESWWW